MPSDLIITVLLGLLVATSGLLAYRLSERAQRSAVAIPPGDIEGDVAAILGAIPLTSIMIDGEGNLQRVSPEAYTFGLVQAGEITIEEVNDLIAATQREGVPTSRQVRWQRVDGTDVVFDIYVAPLSNNRVIVLGHDLTAELRLDETRRDFVANVSHELKTPVGAIALLAETVATAADDPEAVRRFAGRMEIEATRLAELVEDIIGLSRVQSPESKVDVREVPLHPLLQNSRDALSVEAQNRGVDIEVKPTELVALGDAELLLRAIRNLIDNAVRYGPRDSVVRVRARATNGFVEVRVSDEGERVAQEDLERLFERFYRVDQARSRNTGGTGLGLSIVKHIAVNHGGNVAVWSKPGKGTTFAFRVPQAAEGISQ